LPSWPIAMAHEVGCSSVVPARVGGSAVRALVVRSVGGVRERVGAVRARCRRRGDVARLDCGSYHLTISTPT